MSTINSLPMGDARREEGLPECMALFESTATNMPANQTNPKILMNSEAKVEGNSGREVCLSLLLVNHIRSMIDHRSLPVFEHNDKPDN